MKTILRMSMYLLFIGAINVCLAQQTTDSTKKQATSKPDQVRSSEKGKKENDKKKTSGINNKIAVSDQAKPSQKGTKKSSGTSNK